MWDLEETHIKRNFKRQSEQNGGSLSIDGLQHSPKKKTRNVCFSHLYGSWGLKQRKYQNKIKTAE